MPARQTIRIFISSPGDVGQERVLAARVLERLQGDFAGFARIEPILWEHEPLRATGHFQEQIVTPSSTDIVICILWSRLGTRLPSDKFVRPDGTAYASGTEWEFEDAALAYLEKGTPDLLVYRRVAPPQINFHDEDAEQRLAQKRALDAFIDRWFGNPNEGFRAAFTTFETPDQFEEILERHLAKLVRERLPERIGAPDENDIPITWYKGSPYRGLQAFEFEHAPVFFGRTQAIGAVKEALLAQANRGRAFVLVFGRSGGGKSSLIRAGVLPTITQPGVIDGVGLWRWAEFRPSDAAAGSLFDGLATALTESAHALPDLKEQTQTLADQLEKDPQQAAQTLQVGLLHAAETVARQERLLGPPVTRLALLIDQMEELWTRDAIGEAERTRFVAALSALARSGSVWVIGTMRSDFYHRCAEIPELARLKEGAGSYDVLPPTPAEIGQMIRFPTRAAGLRFESDPRRGEALDEVLLNAALRAENALPLLSFTLDELFRQRDEESRVLTFDAYRALGGLEGALARRAEEVFSDLPPTVQATLPSVLRALITVSDEDEEVVTSRRIPLAQVADTAAKQQLVDAFVAARLLVTDRADNGEAVVRVAHEAIITHWPRLQTWLAEDRDFLRIRSRVQDGLIQWQQEARRPDFLLPAGKPLTEALEILGRRRSELDAELAEYIEYSRVRADRTRHARTATFASVAAVFFVTVSGFSVFSYRAARSAERAASHARQEADVAREQRRVAEEQRRLAEAATTRAHTSQQQAERARAVAEKQRRVVEQQRQAAENARRVVQAQKALAQAQRAAAEKNYRYAIAAADTMVTELAEGIRPIAGTQSRTVQRILSNAAGVYDRLLAEGETPAALAGKARMLSSFVDLYLRLNDTTRALESAREAEAILERLSRQEPGNAQYRADLAKARDLLGRALNRRGRVTDAQRAYRSAVTLWRDLAAASAGTTAAASYRSGLAGSLVGMGSASSLLNDKETTRACYEEAARLRRMLAAQAPRDPQRQSDLGYTLLNLADLSSENSERTAATLRICGTGLQTLETAARLQGREAEGDADLQKRLAEAHESLGYACKEVGDITGARTHITRSSAIAERFSRLDPRNAEWLSALLRTRQFEADLDSGSADPRREMRELLALLDRLQPRLEQLSASDPHNLHTVRSLLALEKARATAQMRLGQLGERPAESFAAAGRSCDRLDSLAVRVLAADPECYSWQMSKALAAILRAEWHLAQNRPDKAVATQLVALRTRLAAEERLAAAQPGNPKWLRATADSHGVLSLLHRQLASLNADHDANMASAFRHQTASLAAYQRAWDRGVPARERTALRTSLAEARTRHADIWSGLIQRKQRPFSEYPAVEAELRRAFGEYEALHQATPRASAPLEGMRAITLTLWQILTVQNKTVEAARWQKKNTELSGRLAALNASRVSPQNRDRTSVAVSRTEAASSGVTSQFLIPILKDRLPLAGTVYLSQPTTANYREVVQTALDLAEELMKTPTSENVREAREALTLAYMLHQKARDEKKISDPAMLADQGKLTEKLAAAFAKLPQDTAAESVGAASSASP